MDSGFKPPDVVIGVIERLHVILIEERLVSFPVSICICLMLSHLSSSGIWIDIIQAGCYLISSFVDLLKCNFVFLSF